MTAKIFSMDFFSKHIFNPNSWLRCYVILSQKGAFSEKKLTQEKLQK